MQKAEPYQRLAFYYGMKAYDRLKNFTKKGTGRFFNGVISDPSTYLGLGTFIMPSYKLRMLDYHQTIKFLLLVFWYKIRIYCKRSVHTFFF